MIVVRLLLAACAAILYVRLHSSALSFVLISWIDLLFAAGFVIRCAHATIRRLIVLIVANADKVRKRDPLAEVFETLEQRPLKKLKPSPEIKEAQGKTFTDAKASTDVVLRA